MHHLPTMPDERDGWCSSRFTIRPAPTQARSSWRTKTALRSGGVPGSSRSERHVSPASSGFVAAFDVRLARDLLPSPVGLGLARKHHARLTRLGLCSPGRMLFVGGRPTNPTRAARGHRTNPSAIPAAKVDPPQDRHQAVGATCTTTVRSSLTGRYCGSITRSAPAAFSFSQVCTRSTRRSASQRL